MYTEKIIIECLDEDGSIQTSIIEDEKGANILVDYAFRKKGKSGQRGPFLILSQNQKHIRKHLIPDISLSPEDFRCIEPNKFAFRQEWINIRLKEKYSLGLYALGLPRYAHLLSLEVNDPYRPGKQFQRKVIKDNENYRYFILMELRSGRFSFSFEIRCTFLINKETFLKEKFYDSEYEMFGDAITESGFREFSELIPEVPLVKYEDNKEYNIINSTGIQFSTGPSSPIQNVESITGSVNLYHPQGGQLKSEIEKLLSEIRNNSEIDDYYKEKSEQNLSKITKELSKTPDNQDKDFIQHYWSKTISFLKDIGTIASLISVISKLLGL